MEFLNIGLPEALLIAVLIFLLLGADGTVETARKIGRFFHRVAKSPLWAEITQTRQQVQDATRQIMQEAALQEDVREIQEFNKRVTQSFSQLGSHAPVPYTKQAEIPSSEVEKPDEEKSSADS